MGDDQSSNSKINASSKEYDKIQPGVSSDSTDSNTPSESKLSKAGSSLMGSSLPSTCQKRDENPFSFKHFLQSTSAEQNYEDKGARPKLVCSNRFTGFHENESENEELKLMPELSNALPDFVQDHLIIEQSFAGRNSAQHSNSKNLPDFTQKCRRETERPTRGCSNNIKLSKKNKPTSQVSLPLDLPPHTRFPLDLPVGTQHQPNSNSCQSINEVGNSKSLPDFLTDSAVCSQKLEDNSVESPQGNGDTLKLLLEFTRFELSEQTSLNEELRKELISAKKRTDEYTKTLELALRNAEDSLEKTKARMAGAESTITKLMEEIKSLNGQVCSLRTENQHLRNKNRESGYFNASVEVQACQLARDLRTAANSAEQSLRQLLSGVDNLRIIASTLENSNSTEEKPDLFQATNKNTGLEL